MLGSRKLWGDSKLELACQTTANTAICNPCIPCNAWNHSARQGSSIRLANRIGSCSCSHCLRSTRASRSRTPALNLGPESLPVLSPKQNLPRTACIRATRFECTIPGQASYSSSTSARVVLCIRVRFRRLGLRNQHSLAALHTNLEEFWGHGPPSTIGV